jgi:vancomycin resistance protein VanJ
MTRFIRAFGRLLAHASTALLAGGLTVRTTIGDSIPGFSTIYYAAPWSILAVASLLPCFLWLRRRKTIPAAGFAAVSVLCAIAWIRTSFRTSPPQPPAQEILRIAYWNTGRPDANLDTLLDEVRAIDAGIFGFGETLPKRTKKPRSTRWEERLPKQSLLTLRRGMLLATSQLNDRGQYSLLRTKLKGRDVFVLMVDFDAIIAWSRKPAFDRLLEIIAECGDSPLIVMGDFNTPSDSTYFVPLRSKLRSAFETAGSGYSHTWPMPLPVLDLDQIWLSSHFQITRCTHANSLQSDHRAVIAEVTFR